MGAHRPGQACTCCSHRDGSHPLIVLIRYSERGDLQGPQRLRRCTGAPRCLFHLPASVFESDPLIYPATLFWRRFGCAGLVGGIPFSAKFICMGKSGVGPGFDSRPYKKCAHFAHFAENHCRVAREPLTLWAAGPGSAGAPWGQPERGQRRTHHRPSGPAYPTQGQPDLERQVKSSQAAGPCGAWLLLLPGPPAAIEERGTAGRKEGTRECHCFFNPKAGRGGENIWDAHLALLLVKQDIFT